MTVCIAQLPCLLAGILCHTSKHYYYLSSRLHWTRVSVNFWCYGNDLINKTITKHLRAASKNPLPAAFSDDPSVRKCHSPPAKKCHIPNIWQKNRILPLHREKNQTTTPNPHLNFTFWYEDFCLTKLKKYKYCSNGWVKAQCTMHNKKSKSDVPAARKYVKTRQLWARRQSVWVHRNFRNSDVSMYNRDVCVVDVLLCMSVFVGVYLANRGAYSQDLPKSYTQFIFFKIAPHLSLNVTFGLHEKSRTYFFIKKSWWKWGNPCCENIGAQTINNQMRNIWHFHLVSLHWKTTLDILAAALAL